MNIEELREFCLGMPGATEDIKWGADLTFCVGKKMFAVTELEGSSDSGVSFKCTPEKFAELIERPGIMPAHYVARYHWVTAEKLTSLTSDELKNLIKHSYQLVFEKLPKKVKDSLNS